jgi:AraC family transcriptional regulator
LGNVAQSIMQQASSYTIGEEECTPPARVGAARKRYSQAALGVVISGSFDYSAQNHVATAVPGTVILGNPGDYFSCRTWEGRGNLRQVVYFHEEFLGEVAYDCGLESASFQVTSIPPGRTSAALFGRMRRLALHSEDRDVAAYELAEKALHASRPGLRAVWVSSRNQRRVLSIVRHLERYYHEPCSLTSLAGLARLSPYYFLRVFRKVTGQSPIQYVMSTRLRAAANDLLVSNTPIAEIALNTGFNDISHFNASFRTVFGRTPRHWRAASAS